MKILMITFMLFYSLSFSAFAEMGNRQAGGMDKQMSSAQTTHMMTREMMRDMSSVMKQMNTMTRDMNRIMEKSNNMDQTRTRDMAQVMEQLSQAMHNMSQRMSDGKMDKNMMRQMEQHMNQINNMIHTMEQKKQ